MRRNAGLAAAAAGFALLAGQASAAIIHRTYEFTATGFGGPVDPVTGSFTLEFDNAASIDTTSAGLTVNALNLTVWSPLAYIYVKSVDSLIIGGTAGGGPNEFMAPHDFWIQMFGVSTDETSISGVYYTTPPAACSFICSNDLWRSRTESGRSYVGPYVASVPEPATWALLIGGFGLAGTALRRRRATA